LETLKEALEDCEIDEEDLENYLAPTAAYPVLTGREGLALLLAVDTWHPEAGDMEGYALAYLEAELLPRKASAKV